MVVRTAGFQFVAAGGQRKAVLELERAIAPPHRYFKRRGLDELRAAGAKARVDFFGSRGHARGVVEPDTLAGVPDAKLVDALRHTDVNVDQGALVPVLFVRRVLGQHAAAGALHRPRR